ncbi:hypothetical protein HpDR94a_06230 [Helicobacter pylori]
MLTIKNPKKWITFPCDLYSLKLENQIIEIATRLLTSYQTFLNEAKKSANNEITTNKTQAITNITQEKEQATTEITEAKKTAFNELLETFFK